MPPRLEHLVFLLLLLPSLCLSLAPLECYSSGELDGWTDIEQATDDVIIAAACPESVLYIEVKPNYIEGEEDVTLLVLGDVTRNRQGEEYF